MRPVSIVFAFAVALLGIAFAARGFGDEPATLTQDESARVRHLIDDLGSDDFRVREGAQKALASFGRRALPALREAASHESAEVRFRAEQLVRAIEGAPAERPLGRDGGEDRGGGGAQADDGADEIERELGRLLDDNRLFGERMRRHLREMREWMRRGRAGSPFGFDFGLDERPEGVFESGTGARGARLVVKPDGVRLAVREKGEGDAWKDAKVLEAASLEELRKKLDEQPDLRDDPDVASVLRQATVGKRFRVPDFGGSIPELGSLFRGPSSKIVMKGVQIEQTPGHAKVTVTENDADGKPVTKTYEGADLDAITREHPELKDRLGGIRIEVGRGPLGGGLGDDWLRRWLREPREPARPGTTPPTEEGLRPEGDLPDDDLPGADADRTGPFGLQIAPVEPVLREHLGLAAGTGAKVRLVRPESPAAQLGLKAHDIVVGVDGPNGKVENADAEALAAALRGAEKGGALSVDVIRAGRPLKLSR